MSIYAVCTPGLEPALAEELEELLGRPVHVQPGGVETEGDLVDAAGLCLWSRCAAKILFVLGEVHAASLQQLEQEVRKLDWSDILHPGQQVVVKVAGRGRIKHHDAVSKKVGFAIADSLRASAQPAPKGGKRGKGAKRGSAAPKRRFQARGPRVNHPPLTLQVRLDERVARLSLDAGGLLHKRGYRQSTAKAPIRENLAVCILRMAGWQPGVPLVDPMCGAGTFSIEAAMWSADLAPGLQPPPVTGLPGFPVDAWKTMLDEAKSAQGLPSALPILTADRDKGACRATQENAARAGVHLTPVCKDIGQAFETVPEGPGLVVLNPPYGVRVADNVKLAPLYHKIGGALRAQFPGWRVVMVCPDKALAGRVAKMEELARFKNGGISVGVYVGQL